MNKVIECRNLTHYYSNKMVFENLNLELEEGRILGLLGKNGAGKSTTINIMNGFLEPQSGECLIYGENSQRLSTHTKKRIGFLIEGHVQYAFMNIREIEKFYSGFYDQWQPEPFWDLVSKLGVEKKQKISTMSCGQQSQVALGLILAQDPDLLILDDFSMGLDPGYRRLFVDYLRTYAKEKKKTIFATSHITQDIERLIDDVVIMGHNKILAQCPLMEFSTNFKQFSFQATDIIDKLSPADFVTNIEVNGNKVDLFTYANEDTVRAYFMTNNITHSEFKQVDMPLEDAFLGLTGKY